MPANDILTRPDLEIFRDQFDARVNRGNPDVCWPWMGPVEDAGYGLFTVIGKADRAHRWAYVFSKGPIGRYSATRSLCICHACDNRLCCNPEHLFEGTDADNAADMVTKGRQMKGENHHATKLTDAMVRAIRRDPRSARQVGETYGVTGSTVWAILRYETWTHVDPDKQAEYDHFRNIHAQPPTRGGAKLVREQVLAIRADDRPVVELAVAYDVTSATIRAIKAGKTWLELPGPVVKSRRKTPLTGDDRKRKITRKMREEIHTSIESPVVLAERYGISQGSVYNIRTADGGALTVLQTAVRTMQDTREPMDEGWFVPMNAMVALDKLVEKKQP